MKETTYKYQTEYENTTGCFWQPLPAKYVKYFATLPNVIIQNSLVLDIGAGEGKNSVFLADLNANVIAVDISPIALSRFKMQPNYAKCAKRIKTINEDFRTLSFEKNTFDIIVAYGILHCLDSKEEVFAMLSKISSWLKSDGYFICSTFTNKISVPDTQAYLKEDSFLAEGELENSLNNFTIIKSENEIITETHPTNNIEHQHSLVRLIAKKNE